MSNKDARICLEFNDKTKVHSIETISPQDPKTGLEVVVKYFSTANLKADKEYFLTTNQFKNVDIKDVSLVLKHEGDQFEAVRSVLQKLEEQGYISADECSQKEAHFKDLILLVQPA